MRKPVSIVSVRPNTRVRLPRRPRQVVLSMSGFSDQVTSGSNVQRSKKRTIENQKAGTCTHARPESFTNERHLFVKRSIFEALPSKVVSVSFVREQRIGQGVRRSLPEWRAYFDRACGLLPSINCQLAYVQEATNGMELSRRAVLASRENGDFNGRLERYTGNYSIPADIAA
jgi:hypothetical protein